MLFANVEIATVAGVDRHGKRRDVVTAAFMHLLGIIAEHRGSSYGVYSARNIVVYPRLQFQFDTAARIFGERIEFHDAIGNFTNLRQIEGLLMYNVDGKGLQTSVGWHDLHLNLYKLGDMLNGIGLNTNDANDIHSV